MTRNSVGLGGRGGCVIRFSGPYHDLDVERETQIDGPWNGWVRLKYEMTDYGTGEPLAIEDKITSQPHDHRSVGCDGGSCARI
jgi:hypothetical protein